MGYLLFVVAILGFSCQCTREKSAQIPKDSSAMHLCEKESGNVLSRSLLVERLKRERFDILIIGGGATGAGALLDGATRGLKVALVEANDYSSATSSRSTKLVHGGVRYLENAVKHLDWQQYTLVREALRERSRFLANAPYLTKALPIITPIYGWFDAVYYLAGLKLYDFMAGHASLGTSEFLTASLALERFPMLKKQGLKGAVLYYDGQFDDARMNVMLILTALREGAIAANYVNVEEILKENGKIVGALVHDKETHQRWPVYSKVVINATGAFADVIRKMDDNNADDILVPSQGSHILLPEAFSAKDEGLIIPKTSDGRVLFLLPWLGKTLAGTTDHPEKVTMTPKASNEEVDYIIKHLRQYLGIPLNRSDVLATFSAFRPLVKPRVVSLNTASISRDHYIEVSPSKLISIVGGKWTTYRKMGEDVINVAVSEGKLSPHNDSLTKDLKLLGAAHYTSSLAEELVAYEKLAPDIAAHLAESYGDRVDVVLDVEDQRMKERLVLGYPFIKAEVIYALAHEHAIRATDVLARRIRLAFLDNRAARAALPRVVTIMAKSLNWSRERIREELRQGTEFLDTMLTEPPKYR